MRPRFDHSWKAPKPMKKPCFPHRCNNMNSALVDSLVSAAGNTEARLRTAAVGTDLSSHISSSDSLLADAIATVRASWKALSDFTTHLEQRLPNELAALRAQNENLARQNAALAARVTFVLSLAQHEGTAYLGLVARALQGTADASELDYLRELAHSDREPLAFLVLALVRDLASDIHAHRIEVTQHAQRVAAAVALCSLHALDFPQLAQPLVERAGTASPNSPPCAELGVSRLSVCTSPRERELAT